MVAGTNAQTYETAAEDERSYMDKFATIAGKRIE
jgi:hypothetical protein